MARTPRRPSAGGQDPFDLWLRTHLAERWAMTPADEAVPDDLLRLACDSRPEWSEMKERWSAEQIRASGALD